MHLNGSVLGGCEISVERLTGVNELCHDRPGTSGRCPAIGRPLVTVEIWHLKNVLRKPQSRGGAHPSSSPVGSGYRPWTTDSYQEEESEWLQLPGSAATRPPLRSKEILRDEVLQPPTGNGLGSDHHPDIVDALLPGQRHIAIYALEDVGEVLEVDVLACATDEDAPS